MGDNEQKALQLVEEAEKKLGAKAGFLSALFGGSSKTDEALEMLGRAANMFKMAKKWSQAGNTFTKIANHHAKVRSAGKSEELIGTYSGGCQA